MLVKKWYIEATNIKQDIRNEEEKEEEIKFV